MTRTLRLTAFSEPSAVLAAQYHGFLEDVGLALDVEYPQGSRSQMEGLLAGRWDVAHTNADNVMKFRAFGHAGLFIFLVLDRGIAQKLVVQPHVKDWDDLRGGPVGVDAPDSGYAFVVYEMLRRHGLERDDYEVRPVGATIYRLRALQNGEINAGLLSHHHEATALDGGFHILADTRDHFASHAGVTAATTTQWAERNDETLHDYTLAMLTAAQWVQDPANQEEVVKVVAKGRGIDEKQARRMLAIREGRAYRNDLVGGGRRAKPCGHSRSAVGVYRHGAHGVSRPAVRARGAGVPRWWRRPVSSANGASSMPAAITWRATLTSRWALVSLAALLYWIASHSLRPFVVLRLDGLGASAQEIGLVAAGYAFFALFVAIPGGRAIDRLGSGRVLYGSVLAMGGLGIAYAFAETVIQLFVLQMINGVVELGVWLAIQTLATHAGSGDALAKQLSLFSFAWGLGIAVGPTVGGFGYDQFGFVGLALIYSGLALAILLAILPAPGKSASPQPRGRSLRRDAWQTGKHPAIRGVLLSSFVAMYIISIKNTFYPLSLEERGLTAAVIGVLLSVMGVASLLIRLMLPAALRRFGPSTVLVVSSLVGVAGISLTPWLFHPALLVIAAAATGAGYGANPPVAMQLLGEHSAQAHRGLVMGLRAAASRLAQVIQPIVFGSLATAVGTALAFPISGTALLVMALWTRRDLLTLDRSEPPDR